MKYTVTETAVAGDNDPVNINWVRSGDALRTVAAVARILSEPDDDTSVPASIRPRLLSITITAEED